MLLTKIPMRPEYFNRVPLNSESFEHYLGTLPNSSFYIYFSQDKDQVFYKYKTKDGVLKEESCSVPISKQNFSFFLKASNNMISLNYHGNNTNNYSKCAIISLNNEDINNFYVSMLAKCQSKMK